MMVQVPSLWLPTDLAAGFCPRAVQQLWLLQPFGKQTSGWKSLYTCNPPFQINTFCALFFELHIAVNEACRWVMFFFLNSSFYLNCFIMKHRQNSTFCSFVFVKPLRTDLIWITFLFIFNLDSNSFSNGTFIFLVIFRFDCEAFSIVICFWNLRRPERFQILHQLAIPLLVGPVCVRMHGDTPEDKEY